MKKSTWNNLRALQLKAKKIKSYDYVMHFMAVNKQVLLGGKSLPSMKALGFKCLFSDAGIFYCKVKGNLIIAVVHVDDAMFFGKDLKLVNQKKQLFMDKWECRDLGEAKEFLCMHIQRKGQDVYLDQTVYLQKVIQRFGMENAKAAPTPLPTGWNPKENTGKADPKLIKDYQTIIRSLLYIVIGTCPDISYAVMKLATFAANPSHEHWEKVKYILRYLLGSKDYRLVYRGKSSKGLIAYTDSDWAADLSADQSLATSLS